MTDKTSTMEMAEKVIGILARTEATQRSLLRTELYALFSEYEIKKKRKDEEIYNEGLL